MFLIKALKKTTRVQLIFYVLGIILCKHFHFKIMFTFGNIMQLYSFTFPVDVFFGGHCVVDSAPAWAPALLLQFRVQTVVTLLHTKGLPVYSYNGAFLVAQIPPKTWHPASAMLLPQYEHYGSAALDGNLRMNNDVTGVGGEGEGL